MLRSFAPKLEGHAVKWFSDNQAVVWIVQVELALQSRAPSTIKNYSGTFCHWKKWTAAKLEIGPNLPPKPIYIALYLSFLVQHCRSSAPLMEAVSALRRLIRWLQWKIPLPTHLCKKF